MLHRVAPTEPVRYHISYHEELIFILEATNSDARQLESE